MTRYWIADPIGHRKHAAAQPVEVPPFFEGATVFRLDQMDEWVCDVCNATIDTVNEDGRTVPVPVVENSALCKDCMVDQLCKESMVDEVNGPMWSLFGCGCPPCRTETERIVLEINAREALCQE